MKLTCNCRLERSLSGDVRWYRQNEHCELHGRDPEAAVARDVFDRVAVHGWTEEAALKLRDAWYKAVSAGDESALRDPTAWLDAWLLGLTEIMMNDRLLTQAEVDALPTGTRIQVIWSGGNGPSEYRVLVDEWGTRWAEVVPGAHHLLEAVGPRPLTEVRLVVVPGEVA